MSTAQDAAAHPDAARPDTIHQDGESGRWGKIPARWLDHPDIDADAIAVLAALSTFADRSGRCWPSQSTLAGKLKRSRSWVSKIVTRLAAIGVLEVKDRWSENGGRQSSVYTLVMDSPAVSGAAMNAAAKDRSVGNSPVPVAGTPCSAGRQEHRNPEQIPHSHARHASEVDAGKVDEAWTPDAADIAWAKATFDGIDPLRHAEGFVLRCRAHGYRYRDVGAAWRAWLIQDVAAGKAPPAVSPAPAKPRAGRAGAVGHGSGDQRLAAWASVAARLHGTAPGHRHPA